MNLAVVGLGNVLLGDDGFGPFVLELLRRRYTVPPEVELLDLGTPGLGLVTYLHGLGAGIPGDVRVYDGDELARLANVPRVSPHDPAVAEALSIARAAGGRPRDACLVATVPGSCELGAALSEAVRAAADVAVEIVRRRVEGPGFSLRPREAASVERDWWSRSCR